MSQFLSEYERMRSIPDPVENMQLTSKPSIPSPPHSAFVVLKNSLSPNEKSQFNRQPEDVFRPKRPSSPLDLSGGFNL